MLRRNILDPHHRVLLGGGVPASKNLVWCCGVWVTFLTPIQLYRLPGQSSISLNFLQEFSQQEKQFLSAQYVPETLSNILKKDLNI